MSSSRIKKAVKLGITTLAVALAFAIGIRWGTVAWADDSQALGRKLIISAYPSDANRARLNSSQKGPGVQFGMAGQAALFDAQLQVYYVDNPSNVGTLAIPAPWTTANATAIKFKNAMAPAGSPVKIAIVKEGKTAKVKAVGLGGLDVSTPPGSGGIITILTINNSNDSSTHRICSLYSEANGSVIQYDNTASRIKLKASNGVGIPCPVGGAGSCTDSIKNGSETGIDCGGGSCPNCSNGQGCSLNSDCVSGICTGNICQAPGSCTDTTKNGNETDVDCGGGACPQCANGLLCQVGSAGGDCQSLVCVGGVCQTPTCTDFQRNGTETDVDCGGPCTTKCAAGQGCSGNGDCSGGNCTGGICQPTCSDGVKNGSETGIDCGGGTCGVCSLGGGCNVGTDCSTGTCAGNVCKCTNQDFSFSMQSSNGGTFTAANWPGGTATQGTGSCNVTVTKPTGDVSLTGTLGDAWRITGTAGFSSCVGVGGEDGNGVDTTDCSGLTLSIGYVEAARPSCTSALCSFCSGHANDVYHVQCLQ